MIEISYIENKIPYQYFYIFLRNFVSQELDKNSSILKKNVFLDL